MKAVPSVFWKITILRIQEIHAEFTDDKLLLLFQQWKKDN